MIVSITISAGLLRLQNFLIGAHAIPDELAEYFETFASVVSREIFARNLSQWNDILHPRRLNRTSFLVRGVASICTAHESTLVERLGVKELLLSVGFQKHDVTWIPHLELLRDPVLAGNILDSFLGNDQAKTVAPYLSAKIAPSIMSSTLHEIVEISIQNLERDAYQHGDWANITWVVEGLSVYTDLAPRFRNLLKKH